MKTARVPHTAEDREVIEAKIAKLQKWDPVSLKFALCSKISILR
jgi:hypothetical protein